MRKMKDSGIEWIGEIPEDWEVGRVKNCYIHHKYVVGDNADNYERLALTLNGVIKRSKVDATGLQPEAFEGYQILRQNELVFKLIDLENVSTSRVGYSPFTGIVSPAYIVLNPRNEKESRFGEYFFLSMWQREVFNHLGDDGVRSSLNAKDLLDIPYPLVSSDEKQKIVTFLDCKCSEIDSIISKTRETIEEYKKLKQSIITEVVTGKVKIENGKVCGKYDTYKDSGIEWIGEIPSEWKITKIKHEGIARNGLTYTPTDVCDKEEGELVLRSSNIQNNKLILDDCVFVNTKINNELYVKENDILICSRNGSPKLIGKNALIPANLRASFGAFMLIYRCKIPFYIRLVLNSDIFSYYLGNFLTVSVNQLTIGNFNEIQFPLPPKQEQDKILMYLNRKCSEIDKLITKKEQLVVELEAYKKSLIYEVVTGKRSV